MLNSYWLAAPFIVQMLCMAVDEFWFHRRRGLPRWERIGHPLDTLTVVLCLVWVLCVQPNRRMVLVFIALAAFSSIFVTKDEPVHQRLCTAGEHWIHAILFLLHPIVLAGAALLWPAIGRSSTPTPLWMIRYSGFERPFLTYSCVLMFGFGIYQFVFWNLLWCPQGDCSEDSVNNEIYNDYGERWYTAKDDPVALLRAEARARHQWIVSELAGRCSNRNIRILDVGCGAGFLANALARDGYRVTGLDISESTLKVARSHDSTRTVDYRYGDAYKLEFEDGTFDVVFAMDFLEHVGNPEHVVHEAARVLKPGGLFFFYTFNRNWLAWLIVIKGVEWFIRNTPPNMHRLRYFIKPVELRRMCWENGMDMALCKGLAPKVFHVAFWKTLATGSIDDRFTFNFTRHTMIGYIGLAVRHSGYEKKSN